FHRGQRPVREVEEGAPCRNRRGRVVAALFDQEPPVRSAQERQDRRQGDQPLRRRSASGLHCLTAGGSLLARKTPLAAPSPAARRPGGVPWRGRGMLFDKWIAPASAFVGIGALARQDPPAGPRSGPTGLIIPERGLPWRCRAVSRHVATTIHAGGLTRPGPGA